MDAGQFPSSAAAAATTSGGTGGTRSARLSRLPFEVRQRIWRQLLPTERKIVQAARRKHPTNPSPSAPPEYTLTIRELNGGPALPVLLHICRESRVLLPMVFHHAVLGDDGKRQTWGIWWNRDVDVLYLDYDIGPDPGRFFGHVLCNYSPVRHLAVGLRLGADFAYRLELHDDLRTITAACVAKGALAGVAGFLQYPQTLSIVYPSLPKYWMPAADQRLPLDIEDGLRRAGTLALLLDPSYLRGDVHKKQNMVTVYDAYAPERAVKVLRTLQAAQDKLLQNRLFYAILEAFTQQKRREYERVAKDASQRWGLQRIEHLSDALPSSMRGSNQVLYLTPMMRFDDGPPTSWNDAFKG